MPKKISTGKKAIPATQWRHKLNTCRFKKGVNFLFDFPCSPDINSTYQLLDIVTY